MRFALPLLGSLCLAADPAAAIELGELFATPAQRAAARFEAGDHEALIEGAPDARWEGLGRYGAGDHAGAAEAFARALRERESEAGSGGRALSAGERDALLFGRATAETRAGRLAEALSLFDEILERDPSNQGARHNRDIARALQALDERGQKAPDRDGEGEGEQGDASGESSGGSSDERSRQDGEGGDREPSAGGERASETEDAGAADEGVDETEEAAAREALAAERRRAATAGEAADEVEDGRRTGSVASETRTPSEREQATEQWLRRIVDDPAGLLRRRLEQNHRDDYPEVGDSDEPW